MYLSYNIILMLLKLSYLFDFFKFKYINAIKLRTTVLLKIEDKEMNMLEKKKPNEILDFAELMMKISLQVCERISLFEILKH